jgi:hypothetical protein
MPLCVSCRGEYWAPAEKSQESTAGPPAAAPLSPFEQLTPRDADQDTEAQAPGDPTPPALSGLARVYGLPELAPYVCARCHQSNERWHEWVNESGIAHFTRFFFLSHPWGLLAITSFGLPFLTLLAAKFIKPVASLNIGIPLALLLIFVNVALLYALKDSLWRYDLFSRVARGFKPTLWMLAVIAFVLAVNFGVAIAFMVEARIDGHEAEATEGLVRTLNTVLLSMTFVNVTLSALFMAGHDYGNWLNRTMPQPIYAQERRLLGVIQDGLQARVRQAMGRTNQTVAITIVDIERTSDAGVILKVSAEADSDQEDLKQLQDWKITADMWGRVKKMSREGPPQYIKVTVPDSAEADEDEAMSENGRDVVAKEGDIIQPWEESHKTRSETTISVTSRRRSWME